MKSIKLLKPQPSPKSGRGPLTNITNCFHSRPKSQKQTYRSPSHSPRNTNRSSFFDKQQKKFPTSKQPFQVRQLYNKCINHKQRVARFRVEGENALPLYCQNCAFQLSQKGHKVVVVKSQDKANQMVSEAKQFLRACDNVLVNLNGKIDALNFEKNRVQSKFSKIIMQIEQQRKEIIRKVNENYDRQKWQQEQSRRTLIQKLNDQQSFFKSMEREFETVKKDVNQNVQEINHNIEVNEFRQIMDIYWEKINKFNEANLKPIINNITQSSQAFVNKYLPPDSHSYNRTIEEAIRGQRNPGKEFTFSKNLWGLESKARQTYSWQNSKPVTQSNQSVVEQKYRPQ